MSKGARVVMMLWLAGAVPAGCSRPTAKADGGSAQDTVKALTALETRLWEAWKTHDRQTLEELFADDYFYVGDDGEEDRRAVFKEFDAGVILTGYELEPIKARQLSPDSWLLAYRAKMQGTVAGKSVERVEMEASVWARRNGKWQAVFLHEVEPKQ